MARQNIGIGTLPNDNTGDPAYIAFGKSNDNFIELYDLTASLDATASALDISVTALLTSSVSIQADIVTINITLLDLQDQIDALDVRIDALEGAAPDPGTILLAPNFSNPNHQPWVFW